MTSDLLEIRNVSVDRGKVGVVRDVSMRVRAGELVGVIGANGAGKTTLVEAIMGGLPVVAGEILLDGTSLVRDAPHVRALRGLAVVPEGRQVFTPMTVHENLLVGGHKVRSQARLSVLLEEAYSLFPALAKRRQQKAGSLSGGEQQMVAVARALMADPKVLILDEPSAGLAPRLVGEVFEVIARLKGNDRGVLLVEQNAAQTFRTADRIYVMELGAVVEEGTATELKLQGSVTSRYLGAT